MATKQEILDHLVSRAQQFGPDLWDAEAPICDHFVREARIPKIRPEVSYRHDGDYEPTGLAFGQDATGTKEPQEVPDWTAQGKVRDEVESHLAELVAEGRIEVRRDEHGRASYHVVVEQS